MAAGSITGPMLNRRQASMLAWGLFALVIATLVLAFGMALNDRGAIAGHTIRQSLLAAVVTSIPYPVVGALVIVRQPRNVVGWVLWAVGFGLALSILAEFYSYTGYAAHPGFAAGLRGVTASSWTISPLLAITFVPLLFPTGRPPSARWRWVGWLTAVGMILLHGPLLIAGWQQGDRMVRGEEFIISRPIAYPIIAGLAIGTIGALASIASVFVRMRRSSGVERDQIRWFAYGVLLLFIVVAAAEVIPLSSTVLSVGSLVLPIAMAIAIVRHRLFDIDVVISRTLLWLTLTGFVIGVYIAVVGLAHALLDVDDPVPSLAATGLVALLFQPVRARVQREVNRFVFGDRDDPYAAVARLGRRLEASVTPSAILPTIVETVAQTLKLPYAALAIREGDGFTLAAAHGAPVAQAGTLTLPLTYHAEPIGQLILAPRRPGEPFSTADRRLLEDLARQIGVAAYAVQLTADLQRSRERLVTAREEERRRLRNDLHDGLGPVLSGLKLRAETARNLVHDSPRVDALLADIAGRTETAVADIRRLVYALRPPALDDLGLVPALRELATQAGITVDVQAPTALPPLPAAVEVATFRIVQEAIANTARHAKAHQCLIRLGTEALNLVVEIRDDGIGLPPHPVAGVGLTSMRERAAELGGSTTIESPSDGGTRVVARLPLIWSEPGQSKD